MIQHRHQRLLNRLSNGASLILVTGSLPWLAVPSTSHAIEAPTSRIELAQASPTPPSPILIPEAPSSAPDSRPSPIFIPEFSPVPTPAPVSTPDPVPVNLEPAPIDPVPTPVDPVSTPYYPEPTPAPPPPPPPPPLKSLWQTVNIALPPQTDPSTLPNLTLGHVQPGVLGNQADLQIDGRWVDFYQFEGDIDQRVVVLLRNSEDARPDGLPLMPYMVVMDPAGQVIAGTLLPGPRRIPTEDELAPLDNQLALRLPQAGRYTVAVFANPGEVGRYGIGLKSDSVTYLYDQTDELTTASPVLDVANAPANAMEISGQAGQTLRITASSYQFDPQLWVLDSAGNILATDDDDGGNLNARVEVTLPTNEVYRIVVAAANPGGRGQYRLTANWMALERVNEPRAMP